MAEEITPKKLNNAMSVLDTVVEGLVKEKVGQIALDEIRDGLVKEAKEFIRNEYGHVTKHTTIVRDDGERIKLDGVVHEKFDQVLAYVNAGEPVFLTGPAGCGKNVLCAQIAKARGQEFYFTNAVTQEYKLTGFTSGLDVYNETQFYKAFKNGGLFMLDEIDASCPEALIVLNCALANGYFDFPAPIGKVYAHPDFRVIAAGNTWGTGASMEYVGRNQLDGATLNRFGVIAMDYDITIEKAMADGDDALVEFMRDFRNACVKTGVRAIVSYRDIKRVAKLKGPLGIEGALRTGLIKGLDREDLNMISKEMTVKNEYSKVLDVIRG